MSKIMTGKSVRSDERTSIGAQAPHRTTPHVFTRADGDWWLVDNRAGRRLYHHEYLQGCKQWDDWFDRVHERPDGTAQWYTAKASS